MTTLYEAAGGAVGLLALAHAWHDRCLADPVVAHPFSHPGQRADHLVRLAAYWGEALGGPTAYTDGLGDETRVLRMHAGNGRHADLDARAVACFDQALNDVAIGEPARSALHDYFAAGTARMAAHPDSPRTVPAGLALPHWDWGGPVRA